jgi:hypothetical protein
MADIPKLIMSILSPLFSVNSKFWIVMDAKTIIEFTKNNKSLNLNLWISSDIKMLWRYNTNVNCNYFM